MTDDINSHGADFLTALTDELNALNDDQLTEDDVLALIEANQPEPEPDPKTTPKQSPNRPDNRPNAPSGLDGYLADAEATLAAIRRELGTGGETWTAGPDRPSVDPTHTTPLWGIRMETDREVYIDDTIISADDPGTVTIRAYSYDDETHELLDIEAERELELTAGEQRVTLGFHLPAGYYLLTRPNCNSREEAADAYQDQPDIAFKPTDNATPLARENYDIADDDSQHGVTFHGIRNPVWPGASAGQWYYLYNLSITAEPDEPDEMDETGEAFGPRIESGEAAEEADSE